MNLRRKAFDRFISILLSVLLIVSIMPLGVFSSVMAAGEDFIRVNAGRTELYLFGAETAEATLQNGYYVVTYTGGDASASGVYVNGSVAAVQDGEISYGDSSISFSAVWLESQTGWIAVKCASEAVIPAQEPQETLPEINDVTVTPFNDRYDGSEHDAVTVTGTRQGDVVTYSVNDGEFTNVMPKLREPGTVQITVKVQRTGYEDFIYSCTAIMANGEISWYDVTPYEGTYDPDDPTAKPAVTVALKDEYAGFDTSMDKIEYSVDGGKTYSDVVPTIEKPGEINVEVRITRSNYDTFNYKVTAKMANATIEGITVTPYSGIYDEKAHGVVTSIDGLQQGDTVLYSLTGDDGSYTEDMPTITDAGSKEFYVRIQREYHDDYVSFPVAFSATVKKAQLPEENIEAKGITDRTWSLNIFFNPLDSVTVEFKNGLNRDDFKITYYDLNGQERDTPVLVYTTSQNGLYKVKIEHISGNYEPLIIENILVALNRATQEIFFEDTPDEIIYGENNKFKYVIDDQRFADESEGKITYSIDSNAIQNGATIDKDTGEVTFTKAGPITVTATREQDSKYAAAYKTYTVNVVYVDTPEFEATLPQYSDGTLDWYSCEENTDGYVLKAPDGWEIIKGSNAVGQNGWSSEISETTGGVYDNYTIAFRNIETGAITDVVTLHDFAIDDTTPNIQEFVFKDKNTGVLPTILRTLTFGLFWNEAVEIEVTSNDGGQASSGIKSIKLYKYNKDGEIIGEVTADSFDSETGRAVFTIEPDFEGTIGAEVEDNVGRASGKNKANNLNSNIGEGNLEGYIMLENTPPVLSDVTSKPMDGVRTEEVNGNVIYSGDAEFSFTASDGDSGLYEVGVKINGQTVGGYPVRFNTQVKDRQKYTFTTEGIEADENGMFYG